MATAAQHPTDAVGSMSMPSARDRTVPPCHSPRRSSQRRRHNNGDNQPISPLHQSEAFLSYSASSLHDDSSGALTLTAAVPNSLSALASPGRQKPCNFRHRPCIHRQTMLSLTISVLLVYSSSVISFATASPSLNHNVRYSRALSAAFVSSRIPPHSPINPFMSIQRKTPQHRRSRPSSGTTWSNAVRTKSELNESKFGVRKRVKSVLDKAKKRTGVENSATKAKRRYSQSNFSQRTGLNIVAETASIGGLREVVVDDEGGVDVALDYISREGATVKGGTNVTGDGTGVRSVPAGSTSSVEEKYEDLAILTKLADGVTGAAKANGAKVGSKASASADVPPKASSAFRRPEDDFVIRHQNEPRRSNGTESQPYLEKDAFTGDVSAAFSIPREPLPFEPPTLDAEQSRRVIDGERVQFQDDMGRAGSGFVVWDVKAPSSVVWDCLLDFQSYPQTIPTVREVVMYTNTHLKEDYRAEKPLDFEDGTAAICKHGVPSVTRAQFSLSKFRLKIAAVHKYRPHPKGDYMIFTLDPASRNPALKYAKGIWYTQSNPDGKEGYTRVWLLCELRVSRLMPQWIVDYAASRAMPRATSWLKPQTEAAAMLWLKDSAER
ncbi:hypothetical protein ACHAWF_004965 [Thalassiosira exigua]